LKLIQGPLNTQVDPTYIQNFWRIELMILPLIKKVWKLAPHSTIFFGNAAQTNGSQLKKLK